MSPSALKSDDVSSGSLPLIHTVLPNTAQLRNSLWWDAYRRFKKNKVGVVSFWIFLSYALLALLAGSGVIFKNVAVVDYARAFEWPSWEHPFGTDTFGRDILARTVHGAASALSVGILASTLALLIGILLGALAGYSGGLIDMAITWIYTTVDSVPYILLIPSITYLLGPGLTNVFIAVGLTSWVATARLVRAEFLKHKDRDYVAAAHALGAGHLRKIFIHILPNVAHLAFVQFGLVFVTAIKLEVVLSFMGLGVNPTQPSWGLMIDDSRSEVLRPFWCNLAAATGGMFLLILSLNLFNDTLREALDPKLKNK